MLLILLPTSLTDSGSRRRRSRSGPATQRESTFCGSISFGASSFLRRHGVCFYSAGALSMVPTRARDETLAATTNRHARVSSPIGSCASPLPCPPPQMPSRCSALLAASSSPTADLASQSTGLRLSIPFPRLASLRRGTHKIALRGGSRGEAMDRCGNRPSELRRRRVRLPLRLSSSLHCAAVLHESGDEEAGKR